MSTKISFGISNMFSLASRERCLTRLKGLKIPRYGKVPTASAAVLVPLCKVEGIPSLLYTVRSSKLRTNSGEVAFPGGKADQGETPVLTALRETKEEIGLSQDKIEIWGQAPAVPNRNNTLLVTPVIGSLSEIKQEDFNINLDEVAEVFAVPVEMLCEPKNQFYTQFRNGFILPVFVAEDHKIWGITAYITHAFLSSILSKEVYTNEWMKRKIVIEENEIIGNFSLIH